MIIIRKNDSATSLLLFIFNNYLTHYNRDALKLSSLLEIMKAFGKSETATRMSLSRTVKAGILFNENISNEIHYRLSPVGKKSISVWNEGIRQFWKRYDLRIKPWDNRWYLVNLEFFDKYKDNRPVILQRLKHLGFGILSTNTWISPYYQSEEIKKLLMDFDMEKGAVEMYGEMNIHQDINTFLKDIFHLKEHEKSYENFIKVFDEKFTTTKQIYHEKWFIDGGHSLPILHSLGWQFFHIATEDASLPIELYSDWIGIEAAQLMIEFRQILLEVTIKYLGKFEETRL